MKRDKFSALKKWYSKSGRKPLVIRGARQTGKSTLVHLFCNEEGIALVEINLERYRFLNDIFKTNQPQLVLREIEAITATKIIPGRTLLFLDEIQGTPDAIACLRYFYENLSELAVIAAGSLLEFTLSNHTFSMPVGRIEYMHLGPMVFSEILEVCNPFLFEKYNEITLDNLPLDILHNKLIEIYFEVLLLGGMPEAVNVYKESKDVEQVSAIHRQICETYQDDFSKYCRERELARLQRLFRAIPMHLGKKVIVTKLLDGEPGNALRQDLELLQKAKIIDLVTHSSASGIPLGAGSNPSCFKILFLDSGLAAYLSGISLNDLLKTTYLNFINKGSLAEQWVGQELRSLAVNHFPGTVHYWQREGKNENAEVDYLIQAGFDIVPIEVKAGKSGSLKSLHQFVYEKRSRLAVRFDLNPPSRQTISVKLGTKEEVNYLLVSLPLYMAGQVEKIIEVELKNLPEREKVLS